MKRFFVRSRVIVDANTLFDSQQVAFDEIEKYIYCKDCYTHTDYHLIHALVYARVEGFTLWPAKVLEIKLDCDGNEWLLLSLFSSNKIIWKSKQCCQEYKITCDLQGNYFSNNLLEKALQEAKNYYIAKSLLNIS
ncbi:hypothetical protein B4U80_14023 [Leptotrombidium deliense]|uniref:PWWP domain-containing protein n=1 Tax=Leptotrombidium deliense TaxID=299467 RepID=A0A443S4U2_9ACAR|nr:hypothetical protein B4U80_14023 [Leptotrombidium deliense]